MNMINSTSTTSTSGVMLMAACKLADSPSRIGRPPLLDGHLDVRHIGLRNLELRYFEQAVHELGRSPVHLDVEILYLACETVEGDDGRNRDEDAQAVETRASAMPPETTDIPPDPVAAMLRKALMIPTTVPKRTMNGAVEPIVARKPRPRFNSISVSDMESLTALWTSSSEASGSPPRLRTPSYS